MAEKIPIEYVREEASEFLDDNTDLIIGDGAASEKGIFWKKLRVGVDPVSKLDNNAGPFDFYVKYKEETYESTAEELAEYIEEKLKTKYPDENPKVYIVDRT